MAEQLFLRLDHAGEDAQAVIVSADGRMLRGVSRVPLSAAASLADGRRVNVLIPASETVVLAAEIPKASAARTRTLLPYSLEDQLATDVDDLHFAAGRKQSDGRLAATVIARSALEAKLAELTDFGIVPQAMYAASDGVPDTPSTTTLLVERSAVAGRLPDQPGFRLEGLTIDAVWQLLAADDPDSASLQHVMIYGSAEELATRSNEIDRLRSLVADVDTRELPDGSLALLATTLARGVGTNLLQGAYAPRSNVRAMIRPWYAAGGLAAALLVLVIIGMATELIRLRQADSALLEQAQSLCADRFRMPQMSACQAEARRRLASAGQSTASGAGSFLDVLGAVATAAASEGLETLSYRNDVLSLDMHISDVAGLDAFVQRVAAESPFEVRTLSNTPQDDGLRSRVQVVVKE